MSINDSFEDLFQESLQRNILEAKEFLNSINCHLKLVVCDKKTVGPSSAQHSLHLFSVLPYSQL